MSACALVIPTVRLFDPLHSIDDVHVIVDAEGLVIVMVVDTGSPIYDVPLFVRTMIVQVSDDFDPITLIQLIGIVNDTLVPTDVSVIR